MDVLDPSGIMVAKLMCGKLGQCPAEAKRGAGVWVRLAEKESQAGVINGVIAAERAHCLSELKGHGLSTVDDIAEEGG